MNFCEAVSHLHEDVSLLDIHLAVVCLPLWAAQASVQ
jgi:hypothetical protein